MKHINTVHINHQNMIRLSSIESRKINEAPCSVSKRWLPNTHTPTSDCGWRVTPPPNIFPISILQNGDAEFFGSCDNPVSRGGFICLFLFFCPSFKRNTSDNPSSESGCYPLFFLMYMTLLATNNSQFKKIQCRIRYKQYICVNDWK